MDVAAQSLDNTKINPDVNHVEGLIPKQYGADAVEVPGARALLASLEEAKVPWAVVTSGTQSLMNGWLTVMKLARPRVSVTAEDVENGKPFPECYLLGKHRLGLPAQSSVLVIEDAPSGIRAGKAAGCKVIGLATTHSIEQLREAQCDWIVKDLRSVKHMGRNEATGDVVIEIHDALQKYNVFCY